MTRLMKRLRRRGKRLSPLGRMVFSIRSGVCEIVVVMRMHRPLPKARALLWRTLHWLQWRGRSYGKP